MASNASPRNEAPTATADLEPSAASRPPSAVQAELAAAFSDCSHDLSMTTASDDAPGPSTAPEMEESRTTGPAVASADHPSTSNGALQSQPVAASVPISQMTEEENTVVAAAPTNAADAVASHAEAQQQQLPLAAQHTSATGLPKDSSSTCTEEVSLPEALTAATVPAAIVALSESAPAPATGMQQGAQLAVGAPLEAIKEQCLPGQLEGAAACSEEEQAATAQPDADTPASGSQEQHPLVSSILQGGGNGPGQADTISSDVSSGAKQQTSRSSSVGGSLHAKPEVAAEAVTCPDTKASSTQLSLMPAPSSPPLATFPAQQLQAMLTNGLNNMCHRLHTAAQREGALRLETEMAAVEREALAQAQAFGQAALAAERSARLAVEQEVQLLVAEMEDEQLHWQEQLEEGRGQLAAAHSALRALEHRVGCTEGQLQAEQDRRSAAEHQLLQLRAEQQQLMAECEQQRAELDRLQRQGAGGGDAAHTQPSASSALPTNPASAGGANVNVGPVDAVLLHHMLLLRQEVAALKLGSVRDQEATLPPLRAAAAAPPATAGRPQETQLQNGLTSQPPSAFGVPSAPPAAVWGLQAMRHAQAPNCGTTGCAINSMPQHARGQEVLLQAAVCAAAAGVQHAVHGPALQPPAAGWDGSQQQATSASLYSSSSAAQQLNKQEQQEHAARREQLGESLPARRRQLHEPRRPAEPARPASAKRRQVQQGPPSRWDYRPAWIELGSRHLRVDDLPASAAVKACQNASSVKAPGSTAIQQQQGAVPVTQQQRQALGNIMGGGSTGQSVWSAGGTYDWQPAPVLTQGNFPASDGQTPPWFIAAGGASSPPTVPVINQYFAGQYGACAPLAATSCPQQQQQQQQQAGHGAVTDPLTRPAITSGSGFWMQAFPQAHNVLPPLHLQQHTASHSSHGAGWLSEQERFGLNQQQRQRPATPGVMSAVAIPAPTRVETPRPRSAASKHKPLAVPPNQVDEGALAVARAQYVQERDQIRAKRMRELQQNNESWMQ